MTRHADLVDQVTRLRSAGRGWGEVKRATGLSVAEAKEMAAEPAQARRDTLACTLRNEDARGIHDTCHGLDAERFASCRHERQHHTDTDGCSTCGCGQFTDKKPGPPVWNKHPGDVGTQLRRLTGVLITHSPYNGKPLGVAYHAFSKAPRWWADRQQADDPRIPSAKRATRLRRAKKKAARR